jgi:hypothetical protein
VFASKAHTKCHASCFGLDSPKSFKQEELAKSCDLWLVFIPQPFSKKTILFAIFTLHILGRRRGSPEGGRGGKGLGSKACRAASKARGYKTGTRKVSGSSRISLAVFHHRRSMCSSSFPLLFSLHRFGKPVYASLSIINTANTNEMHQTRSFFYATDLHRRYWGKAYPYFSKANGLCTLFVNAQEEAGGRAKA